MAAEKTVSVIVKEKDVPLIDPMNPSTPSKDVPVTGETSKNVLFYVGLFAVSLGSVLIIVNRKCRTKASNIGKK